MSVHPASVMVVNELIVRICFISLVCHTSVLCHSCQMIASRLTITNKVIEYGYMRKQFTKKIHKIVGQYPVVVYKDSKKGYWVSCPLFQGCYSQGETIDEALENIREAIVLCKEDSPEIALRNHKGSNISLHLVLA